MIKKWIDKFQGIPQALQKQIILRSATCATSLLLLIVVTILYMDLYLSLSCSIFFLFFGGSTTSLLVLSFGKKYVMVEGRCCKLEKTSIRKRVRIITIDSGQYMVKFLLKQYLRNIEVGDRVTAYISEKTQVFEEDGCQIPSDYLALEIRKGSS